VLDGAEAGTSILDQVADAALRKDLDLRAVLF
jgi:hypothetical protein